MQKFFHSVSLSIEDVFERYLLAALIITAAGVALMVLGITIAARARGKSIKNELSHSRYAICASGALLLYISVIFNAAVFTRLSQPEQDPFAKVWGGWGITDQTYYYELSSIFNVIIFLPLCTLLFLFLKTVLQKNPDIKKLTAIGAGIGFLISCMIEGLQIILRAGTFQVSDLFYNTLGSGARHICVYRTQKGSRIPRVQTRGQKNEKMNRSKAKRAPLSGALFLRKISKLLGFITNHK